MRGAALPWRGSARNGLPEGRPGGYVHPGWVGGRPSAADNPVRGGCCSTCGMAPSSSVHKARCLDRPQGPPLDPLCGTVEGYRQHLNRGQVADAWCLAVWALRSRLDRARHDPTKCQACGYMLSSRGCVRECGPGAGVRMGQG